MGILPRVPQCPLCGAAAVSAGVRVLVRNTPSRTRHHPRRVRHTRRTRAAHPDTRESGRRRPSGIRRVAPVVQNTARNVNTCSRTWGRARTAGTRLDCRAGSRCTWRRRFHRSSPERQRFRAPEVSSTHGNRSHWAPAFGTARRCPRRSFDRKSNCSSGKPGYLPRAMSRCRRRGPSSRDLPRPRVHHRRCRHSRRTHSACPYNATACTLSPHRQRTSRPWRSYLPHRGAEAPARDARPPAPGRTPSRRGTRAARQAGLVRWLDCPSRAREVTSSRSSTIVASRGRSYGAARAVAPKLHLGRGLGRGVGEGVLSSLDRCADSG